MFTHALTVHVAGHPGQFFMINQFYMFNAMFFTSRLHYCPSILSGMILAALAGLCMFLDDTYYVIISFNIYPWMDSGFYLFAYTRYLNKKLTFNPKIYRIFATFLTHKYFTAHFIILL